MKAGSTMHSIIFIFLLIILQMTFGQDSLTVEWIYSDIRDQIDQVPEYCWTEQGWVILYDDRVPASRRTFEKIDPRSAERLSLFDMRSALDDLSRYLDSAEMPSVLPWPETFDSRGQRAVFSFQHDLFLLDIPRVKFTPVTRSAGSDTLPRFSPDGQKIAFLRENNLYVYHITDGREVQLTRDGSETLLNGRLSWVYWEEIFDNQDGAFWWSPDSRHIAYLQTDEGGVDDFYHVDHRSPAPKLITQKYPKAGHINPAVRLGVVDSESTATTWIKIDRQQYEYMLRVQWLQKSHRLAIQTMDRSQTHLNLYLADPASGEAQPLLVEVDSAWVKVNDDLIFLKDEKELIWTSERTGYNHIYRFLLDNLQLIPVTQGNWSVRAASRGSTWNSDAVYGLDEKAGWIYFAGQRETALEQHLYRIRPDGSGIHRLSTESGVHHITFSPDMKYYLDEFSSHAIPPSLSLYRNDGERLLTLSEPQVERVNKLNLQNRQFFHILTADGFPLPACLLKPADFDPAGKYPVILYVYGGPSASVVVDKWHRGIFFDNLLAGEGYLVFSVDNRSSAGIGKKFESLILHRLWGELELNDLLEAVKWLKSQAFVDPERIGIWGWSGGGIYTLLAMTRSREFKAGIAVAPVTDWRFYDTKYSEFAMKRPQDNPEGYEITSLLTHASRLHGRLLLVHGTYDDNVHIQNTWAFADELIRHHILFDMMIYPMRKHGFSDDAANIHLRHTMLEFWLKNL